MLKQSGAKTIWSNMVGDGRMWAELQQRIEQLTGREFVICDRTPISGGSINQAYRLSDGQQDYFLKLNAASQLAMFEAEAAGLQAMHKTQTLRVPQPLGSGIIGEQSYLVLEWIPLGPGDPQSWRVMGQQLAAMHRHTSAQGWGWPQNNTIGSTPQLNDWMADWPQFYAKQRLGYQLQLAQRRGGHFAQAADLVAKIPQLLAEHQPLPALVHGDLWSGNAAFSRSGQPIIFDPAVYFGDREVDIAMTQLFGGFPTAFYQGYQETWPLEQGYEQRQVLYNLYHILNHFNLFGGSYAAQAQGMIGQLLGPG